jgi:hypothetical protein
VKVANSERAALEINDNFTQARSAESGDLYIKEPDKETIAPPELLTDATHPPSETLGQDRIQKADTGASAPTTEPLPQVIVTPGAPSPWTFRKIGNPPSLRKSQLHYVHHSARRHNGRPKLTSIKS